MESKVPKRKRRKLKHKIIILAVVVFSMATADFFILKNPNLFDLKDVMPNKEKISAAISNFKKTVRINKEQPQSNEVNPQDEVQISQEPEESQKEILPEENASPENEGNNSSSPSEETASTPDESKPEENSESEEKKIERDPDTLRIGFITDLHVMSEGSGSSTRIRSNYTSEINYFIRQMNSNFAPDFIVVGGDLIEGTRVPSALGMKELSQCRSLFAQTRIPKYWNLGNHDLRSVKKNQWEQALGISYANMSFETGNYKIILVDGNFLPNGSNASPGNDYLPGSLSSSQEKWLEKELRNSDKEKIVFIHQPLLSSGPAFGTLREASEIRNILSDHDVLAVFSGHVEELFHEKSNGVQYFTIPGMTKHPSYPGNFAEISISGNEVSTRIFYRSGGGYKSRLVK